MSDPILEEIHAYRQKLYEQVGNDPEKLRQHLEPIRQKYADRLVSPEEIKKYCEQQKSQAFAESA